MGYRHTAFVPGEWYHCYNRGVDKRTVFETKNDYKRFLETLYLSNSSETGKRNNLTNQNKHEILTLPRKEPHLVAIGAYCLMPNHFHILLKELEEGGISKFMHKVGTSYTMYFNLKNDRTGNLFVKPFRSKHVGTDRYFKHVGHYIHLNSGDLFESGWKAKAPRNIQKLKERIEKYPYSSLPDYLNIQRPEKAILDETSMELFRSDVPFPTLLAEAFAYYTEINLP